MNPSAATHPPTVGSLPVPGATLHYEVRGSGPLLALVGAPMDADSFAPLAELLAGEFTVPHRRSAWQQAQPAAGSRPGFDP